MKTKQECQLIIKRLSKSLNVDAKAVSLRLLSSDDKKDMLSGKLPESALKSFIEAWKKVGQPNVASGD